MLPYLVLFVLNRFFYFYYKCRFRSLRHTFFLQEEAWVDFFLCLVSPQVLGKDVISFQSFIVLLILRLYLCKCIISLFVLIFVLDGD